MNSYNIFEIIIHLFIRNWIWKLNPAHLNQEICMTIVAHGKLFEYIQRLQRTQTANSI